jgi:general secretion pathway protein G
MILGPARSSPACGTWIEAIEEPSAGARRPRGRAGWETMRANSRGFTLIELLIVVAIIGLISAIAIPNLLNAIDKGTQKRTMSDIRAIGTAVEAYSVDNTAYPTAADAATIKAVIDPIYIKAMPTVDGWSNPFQVQSSATVYTIYSQGKDGAGSTCTAGTTSSFNDEICFVNGQFQRFPSGTQQ